MDKKDIKKQILLLIDKATDLDDFIHKRFNDFSVREKNLLCDMLIIRIDDMESYLDRFSYLAKSMGIHKKSVLRVEKELQFYMGLMKEDLNDLKTSMLNLKDFYEE